MRNKGFFWFMTVLLTVACIYQLSFTWVSNGVERKADKEAKGLVEELRQEAMKSGGKTYLPNGTEVDFNNAEADDKAHAAFVNKILRDKAETEVYSLFGSTFKEVKGRSLALGLDLVGGMSVTMEISIPGLVENFAKNKRDLKFKKVLEAAKEVYGTKGGDFIEIFAAKNAELNKGLALNKLFNTTDIDELGIRSTDQEVIDFLKAKADASMDGVEEIMNRRINQFGVAQPNIQKDPSSNRLYIELPGVQDEATVEQKLVSTANLQFFEVFNTNEVGGLMQQAYIMSATSTDDTEQNAEEEDMDETLASLNEEKTGLAELLIPIGGGTVGFATSDNKAKVDGFINRSDIRSLFESNNVQLLWGANTVSLENETKDVGYFLYAIKIPENGIARVGGQDLKSASQGYNQESGKVTVDVKMTAEGADKWAQMTEDNSTPSPRQIAISMDSVVYSAPLVSFPIIGGNTEISGSFTIQEAKDLAGLLNGGALPAPCVIKEQTKVGPTIGKENSTAGLYSFGLALLLVFVYMIFYYGKAGVVADIALIANILFIFGSLSSFGAVLTLAGIAGIVLTIGMAVDANVLIFERIREEQTAGKDLKSAVDTGFQKALSSIIDANVTTLLVAIVLKAFGTGPIESFATTLIIGIFTSLFAALVITRLIVQSILAKGKTLNFDTKMTKGAFKNFKIDFIGGRKKFYIVSAILVIGGAVALFTKGLNQSVEFTGGRTFGVKFEQSAADHIDEVKSNLTSVFGDNSSVSLKTKSSNYFLEITTNYMLGKENANQEVKEKLEEGLKLSEAKVGSFKIMESRSVSASVSEELVSSSTLAILLSLLIVFGYILIRFGKWQYSTGAIIAMLHDVTLVLAAFSILQGILPFNMDIDQAFIAAILTVIGYSINDTVVVFDRIRENFLNAKGGNEKETMNTALNSTLSRTINTSMTTFIVLLIIFLFGGAAIKGFIFALMIGVIVGTYSSLFIATPILVDFSKGSMKDDVIEKQRKKEEAIAREI